MEQSEAAVATQTGDGFTTELVTKYVYVNEKGNLDSVSEAEFESLVAEAKATNAKIDAENAQLAEGAEPTPNVAEPTATRVLSFTKYAATSLAGAQSLVPEESQLVKEINRALGIKQNQYIRDFCTVEDKDFKQPDGPVDLADVCAKETSRRTLTVQEKIAKLLGGATAEEMQAILQQVLAQAQAGAGDSAVAATA